MSKNETMRRFTPDMIAPGATIALLAKRGSGKTVTMLDILEGISKTIKKGIIICPTDFKDNNYSKVFPHLFIHYEVSGAILSELLVFQKSLTMKASKNNKVDPRMLLIMDDCLADASLWKKEPAIEKMFLNGRHYNVTLIMTIQDPMTLGPKIRDNFDYVFIFVSESENTLKKIQIQFAGMFSSYKSFKQFYEVATNNFGSMVIVKRGAISKNITDKVFYYESRLGLEFTFGSKSFINFHKKYFNPKYEKNMLIKELLGDKVDQKNISYVVQKAKE